MKFKSLFAIAAMALFTVNCVQEEAGPLETTVKVEAVMENELSTKTNVDETGYFTWAKDDQIGIHTNAGDFLVGKLVDDSHGQSTGVFSYTYFGDAPVLSGVAVYPHNENHTIADNKLTFVMPAEYDLGTVHTNTNAAMLAMNPAKKDGSASYSFSHLAGVMRFEFKNAPVGTDKFTLSLGGQKINGAFEVDLSNPVITTGEATDEQKTTTLNFTALTEKQNLVLFVPVPAGEYTGIEAKLFAGENELGKWGAATAKNDIKKRSLVLMAAITFSEVPGGIENNVPVATEKQLTEAVVKGGTVTLTEDITLSNILWIENNLVLNLNGKTIKGTADKTIRIASDSDPIDVVIKNGTIVNEIAKGRCVETRSGNVHLTLDGVKLNTPGTGANQPLTVGGSGDNIVVDIINSEVVTNKVSGYAITTFNPVEMNIENSLVEGWCAFNVKAASGSLGSAGSVFNVVNSVLRGTNAVAEGETNNFTTIMIEDKNVTVNVDAESTVEAVSTNANKAILVGIGNASLTNEQNAAITGTKVTFAGTLTLTGENALPLDLYKAPLAGNSFKFPATFAETLADYGWCTSAASEDLVEVVGDRGVAVATYAQLQDALAKDGVASAYLKSDITVSDIVWIKKNFFLDLNGKTIKGMADKTIRIASDSDPIDVVIKNGTIVNEIAKGRCVETRSGNVHLTLDGVKLNTPGTGANQPLTVGGSGDNIVVDIINSEVVTNKVSGYAITTFNPVEMNIENSLVEGWCAFNIKAASGSLGSAGSVFNVKKSVLTGTNEVSEHESNGFCTIMIEDKDITINVDSETVVNTAANNSNEHTLLGLGNSTLSEEQLNALKNINVIFNGTTLNFKGEKSGYLSAKKENIRYNTIKFPSDCAAALNEEGWNTSAPEENLVKILPPKAERNLAFTEGSGTATLGTDFTLPALTGNGDLRQAKYSVTEGDAATVTEDGKVTLVKSGTVTIMATVAEDETHKAGEATYILTVEIAEFNPVAGYVYMKPSAEWLSDGARFAAYFFNQTWKNMTLVKGQVDIYQCEIPEGEVNVIFCRMNPNVNENRWNADNEPDATKPCWNQTEDLLMLNGALYTVSGWGEGAWSGEPAVAPVDPSNYVVGISGVFAGVQKWEEPSGAFKAELKNKNITDQAKFAGTYTYELKDLVLAKNDEFKVRVNGAWIGFGAADIEGLSVSGSDNIVVGESGTYDVTISYVWNGGAYSDVKAVFAKHATIEPEPEQEEYDIYLKPNSNWTQSNAWFAVYVWNGSGSKWAKMIDCGNGIYGVKYPDGYSAGCNIIFARMNSSKTEKNFGTWDGVVWNQTSDLTTPTNGYNMYTITDGAWSKGGGSWSKK